MPATHSTTYVFAPCPPTQSSYCFVCFSPLTRKPLFDLGDHDAATTLPIVLFPSCSNASQVALPFSPTTQIQIPPYAATNAATNAGTAAVVDAVARPPRSVLVLRCSRKESYYLDPSFVQRPSSQHAPCLPRSRRTLTFQPLTATSPDLRFIHSLQLLDPPLPPRPRSTNVGKSLLLIIPVPKYLELGFLP
ncbi:hypothetical protein LY76DRAFT_48148 [Colletotrichum caudatum]|nr:hypothetical protein LY76DRAFT_48148 [Colletotrichum caudatum]